MANLRGNEYTCAPWNAQALGRSVLQGTAQVTERDGFTYRLFEARLYLDGVLRRRLTDREWGDRVGKLLKHDLSSSTLTRWQSGQTVPDLEQVLAMAKVCQVDPGWLAFGSDSAAPGPSSPATERAVPMPRTEEAKRRAK